MITFAHKFGLQVEYVTFDTWYSSKALLTLLKKCNYHYVCMLKNNRKVTYKNRFNLNVKTVSMLFNKRQYRFYPATGFYIKAIRVDLSGIGNVRLALVKNGYGAAIKNTRFIITDMLDTPAQDIVKKYLCRWDIMPISALFPLCRYLFNADSFNICRKNKVSLRQISALLF